MLKLKIQNLSVQNNKERTPWRDVLELFTTRFSTEKKRCQKSRILSTTLTLIKKLFAPQERLPTSTLILYIPIHQTMFTCVFVPVCVQYDNAEVHTYAFQDQGSTYTFCDTELIKALNVSGESESISVNNLNGVTTYSGVKYSLSILPIKNDDKFILTNVISLDRIPVKPNILSTKGSAVEKGGGMGYRIPRPWLL